MRRIDAIYQQLLTSETEQGITASELATLMSLDRANVSRDLNRLCDEGKISKSGSRPVYYHSVAEQAKPKPIIDETVLDQLQRLCPSLHICIEQVKAAILYPPHGMHILLQGETGTGKSMFADLTHKCAIELNCLSADAPFIVFNCAEYANNPQLLVAQLFGCKKGAYTGAEQDRQGLIELADKGMLFLDEVHRLPPEGQEMLFTFIDHGHFRRLGESNCQRKARVTLLCATTENPDSGLLKTFVRRIPMRVIIPSLAERGIEERLTLVSFFIRKESTRLGQSIKISVNVIRSLIGYHCSANIGQLEADIRILCAKAYADYITGRQQQVQIISYNLPENIKAGLNTYTDHRQLWAHLTSVDQRMFVFDEDTDGLISGLSGARKESIYELIDNRVNQLKQLGSSGKQLDDVIANDINNYLGHCLDMAKTSSNYAMLEKLAGADAISVMERISELCMHQLGHPLAEQIKYAMVLHISNLLFRLRNNKKIVNPQLVQIRQQHPAEFAVAKQCLSIINDTFDVLTPEDEAAFLTIFLTSGDRISAGENPRVAVLVIQHGESAATSNVNTCNQLLGGNHAAGFNMPLESSPASIYNMVVEHLKEFATDCNVLLLVDMGSLTNFGRDLEKQLNIETRTIPMASSSHILAACGKAILGYPLDFVYEETLQVSIDNIANTRKINQQQGDKPQAQPQPQPQPQPESERHCKLILVTMCTTGEGSALYLKKFIERKLADYQQQIQVVAINLIGEEDIGERLRKIELEEYLICVTGPFKTELDIPHYNMLEIFTGDALEAIRTKVEHELCILDELDIIKTDFTSLDKQQLLFDIRQMIHSVELAWHKKLELSTLYGVVLHIACVIEKLRHGQSIAKHPDKLELLRQHGSDIAILQLRLQSLGKRYYVVFSDDDACYLHRLFSIEGESQDRAHTKV